jgi:FkbM family methyltransferase
MVRSGGTGDSSMRGGLARAAKRGTPAGTVVDVGASDGRWSDMARVFFPRSRYLLIEVNEVHRQGLEAFKSRVPGSDYVLAAAGNAVGKLYFEGRDPFGGVASNEPMEGSATVSATTIDREVSLRSLPDPYVVKLDTHGFELPILEGAAETLRRTSLLIVEAYNFTLCPGALRFHEMCAHLAQLGFRLIDLCDPMSRPKDDFFWQCDMLFGPATQPGFEDNTWG